MHPVSSNLLAHESSPYLRQHAHNPVHWQPWGDAAWERARAENKLVLVSIGYSACHWCHVMERESFENDSIAQLMNAHFVCIKVDREERPDVDQIYMDAVQLMRGSGGWPLNCFTLPDARPIFGGTYFPPAQWAKLLTDLAAFFKAEPQRAEGYAHELTGAIRQLDLTKQVHATAPWTTDDLARQYIQLSQRIDHQLGGTFGAPKFPVPGVWQWLLHYAALSRDPAALASARRTLDAMADGGIYDQLGGGFARYSVDDRWFAPHFEKMLYDNAQLVSLYASAYRHTGEPRCRQVVEQTLDFLARELTHPEGGFHSALDADSEGVEGKFYTFTHAEIEQQCGAAAPLMSLAFGTTPEGNWEHGRNILYRRATDAEVATEVGQSLDRVAGELRQAEASLMALRETRVRPGLDDKVITGWNGLMVRAYTEAYAATGHAAYLDAALRNQHFIERTLAQGPMLYRIWHPSTARASVNAYLDDYAANLDALLALYHTTFDPAWLLLAEQRCAYVLEQFENADSPLLYYTSSADAPLIARKTETTDSVMPSSNALMAHALLTLGTLCDRDHWAMRAEAMLAAVRPLAAQVSGAACWSQLALRLARPDLQVAIIGPDADAWAAELRSRYAPRELLLGSAAPTAYPPLLDGKGQSGRTLGYLCIGRTCQLPVDSLDALIAQLTKAA
jgi:uncharacterized protein